MVKRTEHKLTISISTIATTPPPINPAPMPLGSYPLVKMVVGMAETTRGGTVGFTTLKNIIINQEKSFDCDSFFVFLVVEEDWSVIHSFCVLLDWLVCKSFFGLRVG